MDSENNRTPENNDLEHNLRIMNVVEKELERQKSEAIFCLLFFMSMLSVWVLLIALWMKLGRPIPQRYMTIGVEIIGLIMLFVVLKFTNVDIRRMGVTKKNLLPALIRDTIIAVILAALMIAGKMLAMPGKPLFDYELFSGHYMSTSILQEFLARGFLLTTLVKLIPSRKSRHIAVLCSSLLFTSLHLYYGFTFMFGAGIMSVILGYCYFKDENIWGVSIIHFVFGTVATMLGLV